MGSDCWLSECNASLFTILNKKYIQQSTPLVISAIEMGAGSLLLTIVVPLMYGEDTQWYPTLHLHHLSSSSFRDGSLDLVWVLILSILCTNLTFYLSTYTLNHLSAFTINLTCNMEPIYGILLGAICFHENKSLNREFYLGTTVVLSAIVLNPILDYFCGSDLSTVMKKEEFIKSLYQKSSYSNHTLGHISNSKRRNEKKTEKGKGKWARDDEEGQEKKGTEDEEEESLLSYEEERDEEEVNGYEGDGEVSKEKEKMKRQQRPEGKESRYEMSSRRIAGETTN
jgi:hypothetical protein